MRDSYFFLSDFHLGADADLSSADREKKIVRFLRSVEDRAIAIYFLGDVFDFWYEYKRAVPKGGVRLLGKMADLCDKGVEIHYFLGNHDMWIFDYLREEIGVIMHSDRLMTTLQGKKLFLAHGDGLGPKDKGYKRLKKVFRNPLAQWLFGKVHPNIGIRVAQFWSQKSRAQESLRPFDEKTEWLVAYAKMKTDQHPDIDAFIFGHRHLPIEYKINESTTYYNLGEWLHSYSYLELKEGVMTLKAFENPSFSAFPRI